MKKLIISIFIFTIAISKLCSSTRVYTNNQYRFEEIAGAHFAKVMLKEKYNNLLLQLLNDDKIRLVYKSNLNADNSLSTSNYLHKAPDSFAMEDIISIFQTIRKEFLNMDTVICYYYRDVVPVNLDKEQLEHFKNPHIIYVLNSQWFQRPVFKSGAKTDKEKISFLRKWIDDVLKQPIITETNPLELR